MATLLGEEHGLNLKETELCLGPPGGGSGGGAEAETPRATGKRGFSETVDLKLNHQSKEDQNENLKNASVEKSLLKDPSKAPAKAQVVGRPPVRSFRKNILAQKVSSESEKASSTNCGAFVKVPMDGVPYLRHYNNFHLWQQLKTVAYSKKTVAYNIGNGLKPLH